MSRRKQSNPKPLKYEENWNETEEGGKSADVKVEEQKDAVDGSSSPQRSSSSLKNLEDHGEETETNPEESGDEAPSGKVVKHNRGSEDDRDLVSFIKTEKVSTEDEPDVKMKPTSTSTSANNSSRSGKGKQNRQASAAAAAPKTPDAERGHISPSSLSAPLPPSMHMESTSDCSNGPPDQHYSPEQLIQAGLPYLHLLPPSIRNDAARFFFMPPNVSPELTAAAVAALSTGPNSSDGSHFQQKGKKLPPESPGPRVGPVYMCEPCNIKFSSSRTLEAHQTYYCSSRKEMGEKGEMAEGKGEAGEEDLRNESRDTPSVGSASGRKRERESSGEEHELCIDETTSGKAAEGVCTSAGSTGSTTLPMPTKNIKTGKLYSCSYCSYSADKKVSLNRHMRMHSGGQPTGSNGNGNLNAEAGTCSSSTVPGPVTPGRNTAEGITAADRYCFDCEIQFTSLKTYKVHKQYYCSTRHVMKAAQVGNVKISGTDLTVKAVSGALSPHGSITPGLKLSGAGSPVTPEGSPIPIGSPIPPPPFVVLPTNPVIIVPYCFIQGASVVPANLLPSTNALIILPNGAVQCLPGTTMPISMSFPSPSGPLGSGGPLNLGPYGLHDMSPGSTTNPTNLSPPGQHSIFNDPKDVIRRICGGTKNSSASGDTVISETGKHRSQRSSSISEKDGSDSNVEMDGCERNGEESIPAIDLTLRNFIKKEVGEEEDEKENQDAGHRRILGIQSHLFPQGSCTGGSRQRNEPGGISQSDVELRQESSAANSPSRQSHGSSASTHSGRRTPRPPSISSSCSSSPAPIYSSEHKHNGLKISRAIGGTNSVPYPTPLPLNSESYPNGSRQIIKKGDHGILVNKLRAGTEKMSPITTQLPGGAILTTSSNQSLAELLMSNPPELTESLAKLNSHLIMNSGPPGLPPQFDPAAMMAAASSLPADLAMSYLANIQHSFQQQQHHHQLQAAAKQQATMKRGVWKCVDCEIVFYKQENFLVHKENYCAARSTGNSNEGKSTKENNSLQLSLRGSKSKESQISKSEVIVSRSSSSLLGGERSSPPLVSRRSNAQPHSSSSGESLRKSPTLADTKAQVEESQFRIKTESPASSLASPIPLASPASRTTTPNHIKTEMPTSTQSPPTQYLCQKCGVKYSTLDNLTTHQTFYCNKRPSMVQEQTNGPIAPAALPPRKSTPPNFTEKAGGEGSGFTRCGRCNLAIPDEQMTLHQPVCHGQINGSQHLPGNGPSASSSSSGWKCPCCDTYSPTMSAAQKHLETHTGIRAFKCVICGYRGNTLRGMRTHIRMHFDKRFSDLQEGDYISCITATDLEPVVGQPQSPHSTLGAAGAVNGALNKRRNRVTLVG